MSQRFVSQNFHRDTYLRLKFKEKDAKYLSEYFNYVASFEGKESFFWNRVSQDFELSIKTSKKEKGFFSSSLIFYGNFGTLLLLGFITAEAIKQARYLRSSENERSGEYIINLLKSGLKNGDGLNPTFFGPEFEEIVGKHDKISFMRLLKNKHFSKDKLHIKSDEEIQLEIDKEKKYNKSLKDYAFQLEMFKILFFYILHFILK